MTTEPTASDAGDGTSKKNAGDFIAGIVVFAIGAYALFESVRMPFFGDSGIWGAPGLTPGILGALLMMLSVLLIVRARGFSWSALRLGVDAEARRGILAFAIIVAYVIALPIVGYAVATFVMLFVFQALFASQRDWRFIVVWALGLSVVLTGALYLLFAKVFQIPLP